MATVYGLPTLEGLESEERGEIVLGGCLVGSLSAVCRYCRLPAQYTLLGLPSISLNEKRMRGLFERERKEVQG